MRCCYNAVNFLTNIHLRHPIARPLGRGMGCVSWIQRVIDILPQFLQLSMQYLTILDCVITALDCIMILHRAMQCQQQNINQVLNSYHCAISLWLLLLSEMRNKNNVRVNPIYILSSYTDNNLILNDSFWRPGSKLCCQCWLSIVWP